MHNPFVCDLHGSASDPAQPDRTGECCRETEGLFTIENEKEKLQISEIAAALPLRHSEICSFFTKFSSHHFRLIFVSKKLKKFKAFTDLFLSVHVVYYRS